MPTLYKFRSVDENGLRVLRDRQIYFAPPMTLNDPLDCQLHVLPTVDGLIKEMDGEDAQIMTAIRNMTATKKATNESMLLHDSFEEFIQTSGVFSISKLATDMLLWSHYANGHRGFCIGFEESFFDDLRANYATSNLLGASKVLYAKSHLPAMRDLLQGIVQRVKDARRGDSDARSEEVLLTFRENYRRFIVTLFLSVKSKSWEYEDEFRAITASPGPLSFPPAAVSEIVFGLRTSDTDQATIRELMAGKEWAHVKFKRAATTWDSFELNLIDC